MLMLPRLWRRCSYWEMTLNIDGAKVQQRKVVRIRLGNLEVAV